jgi:hypothetical protein
MNTLEGSKTEDERSKNTSNLGACLGIYVNTSAIEENQGLQPVTLTIDPLTGEVLQTEKQYSVENTIIERFILQAAARKLLHHSTIKGIQTCCRCRHKAVAGQGIAKITVHHSKKHKACSFGGLQHCASVWVCPPCAAKISEHRRIEVKKAMDQHKSRGGDVLLLTLTNPHNRGDNLKELLSNQAKVLACFNTDRAMKEIRAAIGYIGQIRALEVTHGRLRDFDNGWHPHYHILLFVQSGVDIAALENELYKRFIYAWDHCFHNLRLPDRQHGIKLENGDKAAAYVTKSGSTWGLESEMTKGHIKKANGGESPFDLLRANALDDDKQGGALFREYGEAFKRKNQLLWSPGLKALFDLEDKTDAEIAAQMEDDAVLLGEIEIEDWRLILKYEMRGDVLVLGRRGEWEPIKWLIEGLRGAK